VVDVADPFLGRGGRFEVDSAESGQATCRPSRRSPDLELTIADLGAVYLGGHSFAALAAANRVVERRSGTLARADQLFAHHPLPWCGTFF
jgi:predicted acetyltransferase